MTKWLFKILILVVGVFYLIAFFEIDIEDYKQTWNDQYDSYILNTKCNSNDLVKFGDQKVFDPQEPEHFVPYPIVSGHILYRSFISKGFTIYRLYLWHSVFLI